MTKVDVIGFQTLDFTSDKGQHIEGVNIHYLLDIDKRFGAGKKGCKKFVSKDKIDGSIYVGEAEIDFSLDSKGEPVISRLKMIK